MVERALLVGDPARTATDVAGELEEPPAELVVAGVDGDERSGEGLGRANDREGLEGMEGAGGTARGSSGVEDRQPERTARVDDRRPGRQARGEGRGRGGDGGIGNGEEGNLDRGRGCRRLVPGDELAAVAGGSEGPGQRAPEASAAGDQEVDRCSG